MKKSKIFLKNPPNLSNSKNWEKRRKSKIPKKRPKTQILTLNQANHLERNQHHPKTQNKITQKAKEGKKSLTKSNQQENPKNATNQSKTQKR